MGQRVMYSPSPRLGQKVNSNHHFSLCVGKYQNGSVYGILSMNPGGAGADPGYVKRGAEVQKGVGQVAHITPK